MKPYFLSILFIIIVISKLSFEQIVDSKNNYVAINNNNQIIPPSKTIEAEDVEKQNNIVKIEPTYIRILYKANENIIPTKTLNKKAIVITTLLLGIVAIIISIVIFVHKPKREKDKLIYMETY
ncbi:hypothetical protein PIROE2DRAFT_5163 [Piromyces sp. E2]|nr:hypothetical protein PIROE2DRAFT_5163 [Piromyces sp. E2]|eukprot:OUM67413.1 hypothetical protein PIROE2DRAFT_5163 [Piromyces sp. E2]